MVNYTMLFHYDIYLYVHTLKNMGEKQKDAIDIASNYFKVTTKTVFKAYHFFK